MRRAVLLAVALLAVGCAGGGVDVGGGADRAGGPTTTVDDGAGEQEGGDDEEDEEATPITAQPGAPHPEEGECRPAMTIEQIEAATDPRDPIDCDEPHGTETVAVIGLPADVDYETLVADPTGEDVAELGAAADDCGTLVNEYLGLEVLETPGGTVYVDATLLVPTYYVPTEQEWEEGARWVRCDATIMPPDGAPEEASHDADVGFAGVLAQVVDPALRQCATSVRPREDITGDVVCTSPHRGEHLVTVLDPELPLPTGPQDPAWEATANTAAGQRCADALTNAIGAPRQDLTGHVNLPTADEAVAAFDEAGFVAYACWVVSGEPITGTVQGIGSGPLPD